MNNKLMFSSATDLWATPPEFFEELDRRSGLSLHDTNAVRRTLVRIIRIVMEWRRS
jgi:hypothetical protein